jgi:hypothetical protein
MPATVSFSMVPMIGTCVSLSWQTLQLLVTAKGNKHEHKSLQSALTSINRFLKAIPADGVSDEGNEVLSEWYTRGSNSSSSSSNNNSKQRTAERERDSQLVEQYCLSVHQSGSVVPQQLRVVWQLCLCVPSRPFPQQPLIWGSATVGWLADSQTVTWQGARDVPCW